MAGKRYIIKRVKRSRFFGLYLYMLLVLMLMTTVASYSWFSMSRIPQVNQMNLYITSGSGLELSESPGAEVWKNQLDIYNTVELKPFQDPGVRKPSLKQTSWSDSEGCFYGPVYGYDGRLTKVISWFPLNDQDHANHTGINSYYMKATFYARSGQNTDVRLAEPMSRDQEGNPGAGSYVIGYPDNTGKGPEVAVRLGMRMTRVDLSGDPLEDRGPMFIYEPNIDRHADGVTQGYVPTYSIHEPEKTLVDEDRLILQNFTFAGVTGEFVENPALFTVRPGEIMRIELYIWLEGQDVDCSNVMSVLPDEVDWDNLTEEQRDSYENNYRQIRANLQFTGSTEDQSGMVPIE